MLPIFLLPSKKQSTLLVILLNLLVNTALGLFLFSYFIEKHILKKKMQYLQQKYFRKNILYILCIAG